MASSAEIVTDPSTTPRLKLAMPWLPIAWFSGILILCYLPTLIPLVHQWVADDDMGHGVFVPFVAAYIAYQRRDLLFAEPMRTNHMGILVMLYAAVQWYIGSLGAELFLQRTAFLISIAGSILFLGSWRAIKVLFLPLSLLIFMIPIPAIVYNNITFPLQIFASRVAETVLGLIGIPVLREGNVLELASQKLSVVEACSGIRSLLSLSFLSIIYAYFFDGRWWMRPALLAATIPIAIIANASRVTITGILSDFNPELAKGFFHSIEGWAIFMIALIILVVTHQIISRAVKLFGPKVSPQS